MKQKLFAVLIVMSLLLASSGTALAQGTTPPDKIDNFAALPKSRFMMPIPGGQTNEAVPLIVSSANLATVPTLINGNFDQGPGFGWTVFSDHDWPIIQNAATGLLVTPHSGTYAAWLGGDYLDTSFITQSIMVINPTHVRLWYLIGSVDECGFDYGYLQVNMDTPLYYWDLCEAYNTDGWVPLDVDLSAYAGQTVNLKIQVETDDSLNSNLFIDSVYLYGTFADVPYDHMFVRQIEAFYKAGLTTGCTPAGVTPKLYCPYNNVTRAEMAVFLERAIGNFAPNPSPTGMFADVPGTFWASKFIDQFYNDSLTTGCTPASVTPKLYCPDNNVTRAEMAVFVERATGNFTPTPSPSGMFADVPADHWAAKFIDQFYNDGITTGCAVSPLRYCPNNNVTRQEMAVFIVRAFHIPLP